MAQRKIEPLLDIWKSRVAEVELIYRTTVDPEDRKKVTSSRDSYDLLMPFFENVIEYKERMVAIFLNRRNRVLCVLPISDGGLNGTVCDPKIVFQGALRVNASGIIVAHNHPSGEVSASQSDIDLTRKLKEVGKVMECPVLDHLIMAKKKYFSFADEGLMG